MCSILGFSTTKKGLIALTKHTPTENLIQRILDTKGGDEYKVSLIVNGFYNEIVFENIHDLWPEIKNKMDVFTSDAKIGLLFFSRLTPEMESKTKSLQQPYYNPTINGWVAIHGTIPKAEDYKNVEVDTEIFASGSLIPSIEYTEKVGGKIALISMVNNDGRINFEFYQNGLGLHQYRKEIRIDSNDYSYEFYTNIDCSSFLYEYEPYMWKYSSTLKNIITTTVNKTRIISLFSGGLDITCSTYETIYRNQFSASSIDLWYFDWGTRAAEQEKIAGQNFKKLLELKNHQEDSLVDVEYINWESIPVERMFRNILSSCELENTRLIDNNANGAGSHEAEAAISYVPFRNQFLLTLAAARAEQLYPNDHCIFVLGANLSEGMIYLDNSETFVSLMNKVIKVGGQSCRNFEVSAPFVNRTKTEMVKYSLEKGYDLSTIYSCYFPEKDGSPCGKCGSCLLQQNAMKRGMHE